MSGEAAAMRSLRQAYPGYCIAAVRTWDGHRLEAVRSNHREHPEPGLYAVIGTPAEVRAALEEACHAVV